MTARPINLALYCATAFDPRVYLHVPFSRGGWTYACNGHVAVRVPSALWDPAPGLPADTIPQLDGMFAEAALRSDWTTIPTLQAPERCDRCGGLGYLTGDECESCDGQGEFTHFDHRYECKCCEGLGLFTRPHGQKRVSCPQFGCIRGSISSTAFIGENSVQLVYLHWMSKLPDVMVSPGRSGERLHFRFSGGEAIVMPRHR
jgi:hypothetical protein